MNEVVSIRVAREEDADAIRDLTRKAYSKWVDLTGREPLPMSVDYSDAIRKHRFDLLYVGSCLAALIETLPEDDCLLIENVAVLPAFQDRGFGTRLLKLAEELAASAGLMGMRLYTNKLFVPNIRIYEVNPFGTAAAQRS
jgi:N-acetylglutamate synthase-like GNAT family acetyltransferase